MTSFTKRLGFDRTLQIVCITLIGGLLFGGFAHHHPVGASLIGVIAFMCCAFIIFRSYQMIGSYTTVKKVYLVLSSGLLAVTVFVVFLQMASTM
jgi:FlaA1/EpsC-like NDP-sugar epimerase